MTNQIYMAVVLVQRPEVRNLVSLELERRGMSGVLHPADAVEASEALAQNPLAILVVDDAHPERELVQVLRAAQGRYRIDTRPIYMIAYEANAKVFSRAQEYNVLQLHQGDFSADNVTLNFTELLQYGQRSELQLETYDRVLKARKDGNPKEALELMKHLFALESTNVQAAVELAVCLGECELWEESRNLLTEVVKDHPYDARAKHQLARCYMKVGNFTKAHFYLEQASLLSPFHAERLCDLAQVLMNQYRLDEALGSFREALSLDVDCGAARVGEVQCELLLGEANDALKIMRQLQDPSQFASVFNGAAIVAVRAGYFQQGIKLYKTAASQLVNHPDLSSRVFFNMGLGLWKWGKGELAVLAFDRAVELDGRNEKARHNADTLAIRFKRPDKSSVTNFFQDDDLQEEAIDSLAG